MKDSLRVSAKLAGAVSLPGGPMALDSLLAAAVAIRDGIPPAHTAAEVVEIEIPVQREPQGRFHLVSFSVGRAECHETRFVNRQPVVPQAQALGRKIKSMQINAGPSKGYRIPIECMHLESDELCWWCIGDPVEIRSLLGLVSHLGKRRGVGLGRVHEWLVEPCESWGEGFPIVLDGKPLRPLPYDWPGLEEPYRAYRTLTYPYWLSERAELCAVPEWQK